MLANRPVKKPSLIWPIVSFAITILLFVVFNDSLDENWYLLVLFLGWDTVGLIQYFARKKAYERIEHLAQSPTSLDADGQALATPARITVTREGSMVGAAIGYKVYLNGQYVGDVKNGGQLAFDTAVAHNTVSIFDKYGNPFKDEVPVRLSEGGCAEIVVKSGRVLTDRTRVDATASADSRSALAPSARPGEDAQAVESPAPPERSVRAVWVMGFALLFMLVATFFYVQTSAQSYYITNELLSLSQVLIWSGCIYLMAQSGAKSKALSVCGLLLGTVLYPLVSTYLSAYATHMRAPSIAVLLRLPAFGASLRSAAIASSAVGIVSFVIAATHGRNQPGKKVSTMAWVSAAALVVCRAFNMRMFFTLPQILPLQKIGYAVAVVGDGLCLALFTLSIYALCNLRHRELRTGGGAKVWFSLCVVFTTGTAVAGLITKAMEAAGALVALAGVVGYILLLASRRAGFPILLLAALMSVFAGMVAGLVNYMPSLLVSLISLLGLINPLITWLVIRNQWNDAPRGMSHAAISPADAEKTKVSAVFKIAAIVNMLAGGVLFAAAAYAMFDMGRYVTAPFVFGTVPGGVLIGLGTLAAVQSFGKRTKARMWLLILQLVIACLLLIVAAAGILSNL